MLKTQLHFLVDSRYMTLLSTFAGVDFAQVDQQVARQPAEPVHEVERPAVLVLVRAWLPEPDAVFKSSAVRPAQCHAVFRRLVGDLDLSEARVGGPALTPRHDVEVGHDAVWKLPLITHQFWRNNVSSSAPFCLTFSW